MRREDSMNDNQLVVNFAPTGMIPTKDLTPYVPISPEEVVAEVVCAADRKLISMVHLHARDEDGVPTWSPEVYAQMIEGIRQYHPELIICVSTSGRLWPEPEKRASVLALTGDLKPDMASLTLSSLNFNKVASVNSPDVITYLAQKMLELGIKPELEVFDLGMVNYIRYLTRKELLAPPYYVNILVGNAACAQASLLHMGLLATEMPNRSLISFAGIGRYQAKATGIAIAAGYGVRIGLEDNIWNDGARTRLATNSALLLRVKEQADLHGRTIIQPAGLRRSLEL
jgi:uncharacterized protein (DUF849 family)